MKPARSPITTGTLSSVVAKAFKSSMMPGSVTTVPTSSTSRCTGAGLKKCMPTSRPGRPVRTGRPGRLVGMHFFNPAPVQRLVELVGTVVTEPGIIDDLKAFATTLDKVPVVIGDRAGFIANALLFGYLNHAVRMYEQRYASREDLDAAMRLGCGYPMGPLALLDLIGLDTAYEILDSMYHQSRNRLHSP